MTIREVARDLVAKELWGFTPGREVKPVHFANGFFRSLSGYTGEAASLAHDTTARRRVAKNHLPSVDLYRAHPDVFLVRDEAYLVESLDRLRAGLDLVFHQDAALYPSVSKHTFTLTHYALTTPDPSDQSTGKFLASVLAAHADGRAVEALRDALSRTDDSITRLASPLLPLDAALGEPPQPEDQISKMVERSAILRNMQEAFTRLAAYSESLEKTAFLERAVTLGVFGIVAHVLNATDEATEGDLTPLLLCAPQPSADVREASRAALDRAIKNIARAFEQRLGRLLRDRNEDNLDAEGYRALMDDWLDASDVSSEKQKKKLREARALFNQDFPLELAGSVNPFSAFLRAAVPAAFNVLGANTPDRFVLKLGLQGGLIAPRRGPGYKYGLPTAGFYDMLISALLEPEEEIPSGEFWARARNRFGLLCGADPYVDAERLATRNIKLVSEPSLATNAAAVAEELVLLGHARRYADGFTLVRAAH